MNLSQLVQLVLAVVTNLPTEEQDAKAMIGALKSALEGAQSGAITPANFAAAVNGILATASADDAKVEA